MTKKTKVEVARSFGQNLFLEAYKPINFFMSAKAEVYLDEVEETAHELYGLCRMMVENDIEEYKRHKEAENTIQVGETPEFNPNYQRRPKPTKEEQREFDRREAMAHLNQDIKKGD